MIKANELRIGNKVAMGVKICDINSIHSVPQTRECFIRISGFLENHNQYQVYLHQLLPIPLTVEVLSACGFAQSFTSDPQEPDASQVFKIDYCSIHQHSEREKKFFWYNGTIEVEILSLHQLQNLYFALTGQELEINLEKVPIQSGL